MCYEYTTSSLGLGPRAFPVARNQPPIGFQKKQVCNLATQWLHETNKESSYMHAYIRNHCKVTLYSENNAAGAETLNFLLLHCMNFA